jgi:hypothetical protein
MSAANHKPPRKRAARTRRANRTSSETSTYVAPTHSANATAAAREHYHREKARRAGRERPADHPLEQARRAYHALLAKEAEQAKGGRPRKIVAAAKTKRAKQESDEPDANE